MGFFSYNCAISDISIPAYPYSRLNKELSHVVLVLPNNETVEGYYDGYGNICGDNNIEIFQEVSLKVFNKPLDEMPLNIKEAYHHGIKIGLLKKTMYDEKILQSEIIEIRKGYESVLLNQTMNDLSEFGYEFESLFGKVCDSVKLVRYDIFKEHESDINYDTLKFSSSCRYQGFFYDEETKDMLIETL